MSVTVLNDEDILCEHIKKARPRHFEHHQLITPSTHLPLGYEPRLKPTLGKEAAKNLRKTSENG